MADENEFLSIAGKEGTEDSGGDLNLSRWAKQMLTNPANREGVEAAFKAGKLSATMFGWLREQAEKVKDTDSKKAGTKRMLDVATEFEFDVVVNLCRRALGQEESGVRVPGTRGTRIAMAEIERTLTEVYK